MKLSVSGIELPLWAAMGMVAGWCARIASSPPGDGAWHYTFFQPFSLWKICGIQGFQGLDPSSSLGAILQQTAVLCRQCETGIELQVRRPESTPTQEQATSPPSSICCLNQYIEYATGITVPGGTAALFLNPRQAPRRAPSHRPDASLLRHFPIFSLPLLPHHPLEKQNGGPASGSRDEALKMREPWSSAPAWK